MICKWGNSSSSWSTYFHQMLKNRWRHAHSGFVNNFRSVVKFRFLSPEMFKSLSEFEKSICSAYLRSLLENAKTIARKQPMNLKIDNQFLHFLFILYVFNAVSLNLQQDDNKPFQIAKCLLLNVCTTWRHDKSIEYLGENIGLNLFHLRMSFQC